jgi:phage replication-related protein YjqB (UPF0714/DUF867 family)
VIPTRDERFEVGRVRRVVRADLVSVLEIAGFVAAALAGTGGCLFGVRAADAINRKLGRDAPRKDASSGTLPGRTDEEPD